jgi:hypothetical protein
MIVSLLSPYAKKKNKPLSIGKGYAHQAFIWDLREYER